MRMSIITTATTIMTGMIIDLLLWGLMVGSGLVLDWGVSVASGVGCCVVLCRRVTVVGPCCCEVCVGKTQVDVAGSLRTVERTHKKRI